MRIGIVGGTFDPFHRGHLDPILAARDEMQWDRILYIPAFIQPFKQDRDTASPHHRFAMTVLGIEEHADLYADPRELERGAVSYTVETLRDLRRDDPDAQLDWIIGDDNIEKLEQWKNYDEILTLARFVVLTRVQNPTSKIRNPRIVFATNPITPVSSTQIRERLRNGESIDDLVPARVSRYIQHYGLYRKGQS